MSNRALVELTVRYGEFGQKQKTVAIQISEDLRRELMEGVELSDDPFSLMMASPGLYGGKGDAITIRRRAFKMRLDVAKKIAADMVPALLDAFGANDQLDGYRLDIMSQKEKDFLAGRGRL
jgi:hypothetical protein